MDGLKDFYMLLRCSIYFIFTGQPIWAAEGTRVFDEAGLFSAEEVQELETRIERCVTHRMPIWRY